MLIGQLPQGRWNVGGANGQVMNTGMKVIRHAEVDSRMIILDDQAVCMPDEARDGRNVALK